MTTTSLATFNVTTTWADMVATLPALNAVNCVIQNRGDQPVEVVMGGASSPSGILGILLYTGDSLQPNNAHLWVRTLDGTSQLASATV